MRYPRTMAKPTKSAPKTNEVPIHATHFDLWKLTRRTGVGTNGKKYRTWEPKRLTGAPDAQGRVTNRWLLSELSPVTVRRRWGAGRFRVRYSNEAGDVLGATDWELETPESERQGDPIDGAPSAGASEDGAHVGGSGASAAARLRGVAGRLDGGGVLELMLMMNDQADRTAQRAREDAQLQVERDRQFFAQFAAQQTQMMQSIMSRPAAAPAPAPATDLTRELALMRRENLLNLREVETRLAATLGDLGGGDDGAADTTEALERAGVGLVEGLGEEVPALVGEALSALKGWLKAKGQNPSPQNVAAVIEAVRLAAIGQANGQAENDPDGENG